MEPSPNNPLDRLLRAARRRWILRRATEAGSIGAALACVVSLLLIAVLWWQAESSINLIGTLIACGALLGAVMSLIAQPSAMQTAKRLDEHHQLHDLLATAKYLIESKREDEFHNEIIRHANIVAAEMCLAPMMFARLSAAQKTAMVGLVGMTLTVAAIASSHVERNEKVFARQREVATAPLAASRKETLETGTKANQQLVPESVDAQARATSDTRKVDGAGNAVTQSDSRDGKAFAKSDTSQKPMPMATRTNASTSNDQGIASTGGAAGSVGVGSTRSGTAANMSAPAPQAELSSRSRDSALKLLNNGGVPDAYRDLVRDYFLRD